MRDADYIAEALREIGYRRVRSGIYKASWSTPEVEHFLHVWSWGWSKRDLSVEFGLRNKDAEAFGIEFAKAYSPRMYEVFRYDPRANFLIRFSLGKWANWGRSWSLDKAAAPIALLADRIATDVSKHLFPIVRGIVSTETLLPRLVSDTEPCRWLHNNGAIRAAEIAHLAATLGKPASEMRAMLQSAEKEIQRELDNGQEALQYVEAVTESAMQAQRDRGDA